MIQRFGKHNDKTVEQLIKEDPAYVIWLFERDGGEFTSITVEQYGAAIDELASRDDTVYEENDFGLT